MKMNTPLNRKLLWNGDVDHTMFECCGNSDLVFTKCPACGHLMVTCRECSTVFTNLQNLEEIAFVGTDDRERIVCVACNTKFEDYYFLMQPHMDKYLPTADEVIARGHGRFLSPERRRASGLS